MFMVTVDQDTCEGCGECAEACPAGALEMVDGKASVTDQECMGCETCITICPSGAVKMQEL